MKNLFKKSVALVRIMPFAVLFLLFFVQLSLATTRMPAFSLQEVVDGKKVTSEEFKGKTLLVTFFATWCPPCLQEIPSLLRYLLPIQ